MNIDLDYYRNSREGVNYRQARTNDTRQIEAQLPITVVIPTIPPRGPMLHRCMASIVKQTAIPARIVVQADDTKAGACFTRNKGLSHVLTPWVAFLDDDDEMLPEHLSRLHAQAVLTRADYVYSWYTIIGPDGRPFPENDPLDHFGQPWDKENPKQTTITTLVRTDLAQQVGFHDPEPGKLIDGNIWGEDYEFSYRFNQIGTIVHLPERTWLWHHHGHNTSGRPDRW